MGCIFVFLLNPEKTDDKRPMPARDSILARNLRNCVTRCTSDFFFFFS